MEIYLKLLEAFLAHSKGFINLIIIIFVITYFYVLIMVVILKITLFLIISLAREEARVS